MNNSKPSWIKNIKVVAWDLDGTLYPPNEDLSAFIQEQVYLSIAQKLECTTDEAKEKFSQQYKQLHSTTKTLNSFGIDGKQFFISIWEDHDLSPFIENNTELVTAFKQLLSEKQYQHFIHTNSNTLKSAHKKLKLIGLDPSWFEDIITSVTVGYNKPDKRMFTVLLEKAGVQPKEILYVGDREHTDLIPAKEMGMQTALVTVKKQANKKVDITVLNPINLIDLLR